MNQSSNTYYSLYSDGGGSETSGGAACIVEGPDGKMLRKLCAPLPPCTGNHAEVVAGLLGLQFILEQKDISNQQEKPRVTWHCDSAYVGHLLDKKILQPSAAAILHAQLLEKYALQFSVKLEYPKQSNPAKRALACHRAASWMQQRGTELLAANGEGPILLGRITGRQFEHLWHLISVQNIEELGLT